MQEHTPKPHAYLTKLDVDLAAICFSWFLSLLLIVYLLRSVLTFFLRFILTWTFNIVSISDFIQSLGCFPHDVLFRIALGSLRSNEAELLRCESVPAVYVSLENLPTRMWEADKLLQVCISLSSLQTCIIR